MTTRISTKGFTVLELMVGIIIFTMGFMGAYLLVDSANGASMRSQDQIIGANLMREQIELIKNLRDTNWTRLHGWDSITDATEATQNAGTTLANNSYYTISNDFLSSEKIAKIEKLNTPLANQANVIGEFKNPHSPIRLYLDNQGRYVHNDGAGNATNYASFFLVEPLVTKNSSGNITVDRAHKITVYFASFNKGYRLYSMSTIITDWKSK